MKLSIYPAKLTSTAMNLVVVSFLTTATAGLGAQAAETFYPAFPLKVSADRRHLIDHRGAAFLYNADTPWMLFTKLTEAEAKEYIARRKEQGFSALQVQLTGFLGESTYEDEHGAWGSAVQARKQAYWCALSGGFGHAYGSHNWNFPKN